MRVRSETDREILRLAVPAFLALVAEPLFLLGDAAVVGHLGTAELAGVGVAAVVLQTAVGLCIFLAYGTTAGVARRLGAGDQRGALALGVDGTWLAVLIGAVVTVAGIALTPWLVGLFDVTGPVEEHAVDYLAVSFAGTAPLLVVLAAVTAGAAPYVAGRPGRSTPTTRGWTAAVRPAAGLLAAAAAMTAPAAG